jgi:hypothetical protein
MQGVEHDEAISIYAIQMQARRLLRRPAIAGLLAMTIPRLFNSPKALGHGGAEFGKVKLLDNISA